MATNVRTQQYILAHSALHYFVRVCTPVFVLKIYYSTQHCMLYNALSARFFFCCCFLFCIYLFYFILLNNSIEMCMEMKMNIWPRDTNFVRWLVFFCFCM